MKQNALTYPKGHPLLKANELKLINLEAIERNIFKRDRN
jgi:hypothetical protein